eukprot:5698042-Pleurochrysis_carterae.AAC.2
MMLFLVTTIALPWRGHSSSGECSRWQIKGESWMYSRQDAGKQETRNSRVAGELASTTCRESARVGARARRKSLEFSGDWDRDSVFEAADRALRGAFEHAPRGGLFDEQAQHVAQVDPKLHRELRVLRHSQMATKVIRRAHVSLTAMCDLRRSRYHRPTQQPMTSAPARP